MEPGAPGWISKSTWVPALRQACGVEAADGDETFAPYLQTSGDPASRQVVGAATSGGSAGGTRPQRDGNRTGTGAGSVNTQAAMGGRAGSQPLRRESAMVLKYDRSLLQVFEAEDGFRGTHEEV